jgi:hypothetical protein
MDRAATRKRSGVDSPPGPRKLQNREGELKSGGRTGLTSKVFVVNDASNVELKVGHSCASLDSSRLSVPCESPDAALTADRWAPGRA